MGEKRMYKAGKWAQSILIRQEPDGKWGCFHSLSQSYGADLTTEQALRRLQRLGFSMEDDCIQRAVAYMIRCLEGTEAIPDRREKVQDWDVFTRLILATWIRRFTDDCALANQTCAQWVEVVTHACASGVFDPETYRKAYRAVLKPAYGRIGDPFNFYPASLLAGALDERTEHIWCEAILKNHSGLYYIYDRPLERPPEVFESRRTLMYLDALELLAAYHAGRQKLAFAAGWLMEHRREDGTWDLGRQVRDGLHFPLSDDWRKPENRIDDCTGCIRRLLTLIQTT